MELWDCRHLLFLLFMSLILTCLLLVRFSVIEVKQKEVVTVTSVRYSRKTSKAS